MSYFIFNLNIFQQDSKPCQNAGMSFCTRSSDPWSVPWRPSSRSGSPPRLSSAQPSASGAPNPLSGAPSCKRLNGCQTPGILGVAV